MQKKIAKGAVVFVLITAFLSVMAVGAVRHSVRNPAVSVSMVAEDKDAISEFRKERQQLRAMQKAQMNDILHDDSTDDTILADVQHRLMDLCRREETELLLEGMLEMRGFQDPVAVLHGDSVNIFLRSDMITRQESAIIMDLVCGETGVLSGNVKIIPIN